MYKKVHEVVVVVSVAEVVVSVVVVVVVSAHLHIPTYLCSMLWCTTTIPTPPHVYLFAPRAVPLQNSSMQMLSVLSAIFLPVTFLAGVYGTNFEHLP